MMYIWIAIVSIIAYLIGSINTAILVGKFTKGDDIRSHGSGNAGATNALRTYGKKAAAVVVLGDCLKAIVSILIGIAIAGVLKYEKSLFVYGASLGAIIGHNFPLYFSFKGGKGILVSVVSIFFADWRIALVVAVVAVLIMAVSKYVSLGSVLGSVLFAVLGIIFHYNDIAFIIYAILVAGLAVIKHRSNIVRLIKGTENKLGQKKL